MATSKPYIVLAACLGALLPFIPDLIKLIPGLPDAASNALCAVILAAAYAIAPKQKAPKLDDEAGYVRPRVLVGVAGVALIALACAALGTATKDGPAEAAKAIAADPAKATRDALKAAELACLGCVFPDLPKDAQAACAKLEPVCKGLAGVCTEAK
jgi:hypothetical protein